MVLQQFAQAVQSICEETCSFNRCTIALIFLDEILPLFKKDLNCQFAFSLCFESFSILTISVMSITVTPINQAGREDTKTSARHYIPAWCLRLCTPRPCRLRRAWRGFYVGDNLAGHFVSSISTLLQTIYCEADPTFLIYHCSPQPSFSIAGSTALSLSSGLSSSTVKLIVETKLFNLFKNETRFILDGNKHKWSS